jgi:hypothetical protein
MALVKLNNRGVRSATTFGSISALGEMRFISKQTASASATISFTSGIDSTYKEYLFTFNNIHPATDAANFLFQGNAAGGSGYNETMTTTVFSAYHNETDADTNLYYNGETDQANGTAFQQLMDACDNDNDSCLAGSLRLFNPSNTTFVKHFIADCQAVIGTYSQESFTAGYFNTTSAIDDIQFKMSAGNIDAGDICLYGIN